MTRAIVWSKYQCPYCDQAKALLTQRGIEFEERKIGDGYTKEELLEAIPTEQVNLVSFSTRFRIAAAISLPLPSNFLAPVTSRKASSSDSGSTKGVKERKISIISDEASLYFSWLGEIKIALGANLLACVTGIAARIPYFRAA